MDLRYRPVRAGAGRKSGKGENTDSDDRLTSEVRGNVKNPLAKGRRPVPSLREKGLALPHSDIFIAAIAIEYNLSIFTLDEHFAQIPGVKLYKAGGVSL